MCFSYLSMEKESIMEKFLFHFLTSWLLGKGIWKKGLGTKKKKSSFTNYWVYFRGRCWVAFGHEDSFFNVSFMYNVWYLLNKFHNFIEYLILCRTHWSWKDPRQKIWASSPTNSFTTVGQATFFLTDTELYKYPGWTFSSSVSINLL